MYHFHFVVLYVPLLEPVDENPLPLLGLLLRVVLVEGVAAEPEVAHEGVVDVEQVEEPEEEHQQGEEEGERGVDVHVAEEAQEGRARDVRDLQVVEAQRVADAGQVYRTEGQAARGRVLPVQREHAVQLDAEHRVGHQVHDVHCQQAVHHVGGRAAPVYQAQHVDVLEYRDESAGLGQEDQHRYHRGADEQADVQYFVPAVGVLGVTLADVPELVHKLVEFALAGIVLDYPLLDYGVQGGVAHLPELVAGVRVGSEIVHIHILLYQEHDSRLVAVRIASPLPLLQYSLDVQYLLFDELLLGFEHLSHPMAFGHASLIVNFSIVFLGKGH